MNCQKCKLPTQTRSSICLKHVYCLSCAKTLQDCEDCRSFLGCTNCPNKGLSPLCVVGDCQHKLCLDCVTTSSSTKAPVCPRCTKPLNPLMIDACLRHFWNRKPTITEGMCRNCNKRGQMVSRDYFQCNSCGFLECKIHKDQMLVCKCRCSDCLRETKFDGWGQPLDCRCITSDTQVRERSKSPFRPTSHRGFMTRISPMAQRENLERQRSPMLEANHYGLTANNGFPVNKNTVKNMINNVAQVIRQPSPAPATLGVKGIQNTEPNLKKVENHVSPSTKTTKWRCTNCQSELSGRVTRSLICNFCSMLPSQRVT